VIEEIGSGATSQIFKVRGPSSEIGAAKILRTDMAQNPMMVSRFSDEIAMLREFSDPGIVRVLGAGEQDGRPFLVMELLEGVALNTLISGVKTLPLGTACRVAAELAGTLSRIHERGWIHRDVKPGNIFVTHAGETKLMDFGIGRRIMRDDETQTMGYVLGTPGYMAPEQILNPVQVGVRSDVYSLAATLFEMITGQLPFGNPGQLKDWQGLVQEAPSLLQFAAVPKELAETVGRALSRSPEVRLQTMEAFGRELMQWADVSPEGLRGAVAQCQNTAFSSSTATLVGAALTKPIFEMDAAPAPPIAALSRGPTKGIVEPAPAPVPAPAPAAVKREISRDEELLWMGNQAEQEEAFQRLCEAQPIPRLLIDFGNRVCLWGGPGTISRTLILREGRLTLGRNASEVDLPLDHPSISRQHLAFSIRMQDSTGVVLVDDLSSAAGTRIMGDRLSRRPLSDGDILRVGEINVHVHVLPGRALELPLRDWVRTAFERFILCYDFALMSTTDPIIKKLIVDSREAVQKVLVLDSKFVSGSDSAASESLWGHLKSIHGILIDLRSELIQTTNGAKTYGVMLQIIDEILALVPRSIFSR
jgi:tRNA A-37 threonylcarbamoyl transferase component Bud32